MRISFITCIVTLLCLNLNAQDTGETTLGSWYEITSSNKISDDFSISASFTNWNYELFNNQHLALGLISVNYHINKNVFFGFGYGNGSIDPSFEDPSKPFIGENRIFQNIYITHRSKKITWNHRFRLEQRFLDYPQDNLLKHRIRYRFKGSLPLNKTLFLSIYDEIIFNLNEFDLHQNRAFAGIGVKFNKNINAIFGYARHSYKTKSFNRLSLQLNLKYDFRKKQK